MANSKEQKKEGKKRQNNHLKWTGISNYQIQVTIEYQPIDAFHTIQFNLLSTNVVSIELWTQGEKSFQSIHVAQLDGERVIDCYSRGGGSGNFDCPIAHQTQFPMYHS